MESHEADLRAEVPDDRRVLAIQADYRTAGLDAAAAAMLDFAVKLTRRPTEMTAEDIASLRVAGFDDETVLDIVQTTAYFNYANRVMDALGIEPEPEMRHRRT